MTRPTSIDTLVAVNDELLALARGGLPLAPELVRAARATSGDAAALLGRLGRRVEAGESLAAAITAEKGGDASSYTPYYAALVRAGEASGRLPAALEGLADALRRAQRLRRAAWLAAAYPKLVAVAAFALTIFALWWVFLAFDWVDGERGVAAGAFGAAYDAARWAVLLTPLAAAAVFVWLLASPRGGGPIAGPLGWARRAPGVGGVLRLAACASFCRLLGLMLQHRRPLPEALTLAAEATGWPAFEAASAELAGKLR